jgi:O-succinylbenzoate synthase
MDPLPSLRIERVERFVASMPLRQPFRSAGGELTARDVLFVRIRTDLGDGWGECAALPDPTYTEEWLAGADAVIAQQLTPRLVGRPVAPEQVSGLLHDVVGHHMAKAALATAVLDASLRSTGRSLADWLGVVGERVEVAAAVGLHDRVDDVAAEAAARVEEGYRHLKLKVVPGRGPALVAAVREAVEDLAVLRVDANGAYGSGDTDELYALDDLGLAMIEQPYPADRWGALGQMAADLQTPICLDESIRSVHDLDTALELQACGVVNVKPGRVGGVHEAVELQERCADTGLRAWLGGMLETGVGRTAAVALAALPGFTDPGDTSASDRYWEHDLTEPFVLEDGHLLVRDEPGIAVPDEARLQPSDIGA